MNIIQLCKDAHSNAVAKGWWEKPKAYGTLMALVHSEVSEALEDVRAGSSVDEVWYEYKKEDGTVFTSDESSIDAQIDPDTSIVVLGKPCGVPSELADVCIRIFDIAGHYKWEEGIANDWEISKTIDPNEHEKWFVKSDLSTKLAVIHESLSGSFIEYRNHDHDLAMHHLSAALYTTRLICEENDIDLEKAISEKMAYNATRGHKHGGKVI